jgi:hypothetical protein
MVRQKKGLKTKKVKQVLSGVGTRERGNGIRKG